MRHLVVISNAPARDGAMVAIGSRAEVLKQLSSLNTHPDTPEGNVLYGPGIELHLGLGQDPILQMMLDVTDEDIAWLVIERMGRILQWKFVDLASGNELAFAAKA